jgi:S-adenosylhomocysteine hydrolase
MDGFKVVRIEEMVGQIDILITATGMLEYYCALNFLCKKKIPNLICM